jgi:hypothetical protein
MNVGRVALEGAAYLLSKGEKLVQDVLDLIEKKPLGVLDSLDEACRFPTATGATFAEKLYNNKDIMNHKRFEKPKRSNTAFIIDHYAGQVEYQVISIRFERPFPSACADAFLMLSFATK